MRKLYLAIVLLLSIGQPASAQVISTFNANLEDWQAAGFSPTSHIVSAVLSQNLTWSPSGNPDGSLRIEDVFGWTFVAAPNKFLGNWENGYVTSISFDILITTTDSLPYPAVAVRGENATLYYNTTPPPVGAWHTIEIPLEAGDWRLNNYASGRFATEAEIREVLRFVKGFYILTEWTTGADLTYLDNVSLAFTPLDDTQPVYGIRGRDIAQNPAKNNQLGVLFRVWGQVTGIQSGSLMVSDGSGKMVTLRMASTDGYDVGDYVMAVGSLNNAFVDPTLDILTGSLVKLN